MIKFTFVFRSEALTLKPQNYPFLIFTHLKVVFHYRDPQLQADKN